MANGDRSLGIVLTRDDTGLVVWLLLVPCALPVCVGALLPSSAEPEHALARGALLLESMESEHALARQPTSKSQASSEHGLARQPTSESQASSLDDADSEEEDEHFGGGFLQGSEAAAMCGGARQEGKGNPVLEGHAKGVRDGHGYGCDVRYRASTAEIRILLPLAKIGLEMERARALGLDGDALVLNIVCDAGGGGGGGGLAFARPSAMRRQDEQFAIWQRPAGGELELFHDAPRGAKESWRWSLEDLLNKFYNECVRATEIGELGSLEAGDQLSLSFVAKHQRRASGQGGASSAGEKESADIERCVRLAQEEVQSAHHGLELLTEGMDHHEQGEMQAARSNPLLNVVRFVRRQFLVAHRYCPVCHEPVELDGIKPCVCDRPMCIYQYETLGLGANVGDLLRKEPEVVDLLMTLFFLSCQTASDGTAEHLGPWPEAHVIQGAQRAKGLLLTEDSDDQRVLYCSTEPQPEGAASHDGGMGRIMGRIMTAAMIEVGDTIRITVKNEHQQLRTHERVVTQTARQRSGQADCSTFAITVKEPFTIFAGRPPQQFMLQKTVQETPKVAGAAGGSATANASAANHAAPRDCLLVLNALPSVQDMRHWVVEDGLDLKEQLEQIDERSFKLLRWITCSMRGHIRKLAPDEEIKGFSDTSALSQFVLLAAPPTLEHSFRTAVQASGKPPANSFHGSPKQNWHSIVRAGLNFKRTSHGRAYGNGIYLARQMTYSAYYSGNRMGGAGASVPGGSVPGTGLGAGKHIDPATFTSSSWITRSAVGGAMQLIALCDIVDQPQDYVAGPKSSGRGGGSGGAAFGGGAHSRNQNEILVIDKEDWVVTRYLLVSKTGVWPTAMSDQLTIPNIASTAEKKRGCGSIESGMPRSALAYFQSSFPHVSISVIETCWELAEGDESGCVVMLSGIEVPIAKAQKTEKHGSASAGARSAPIDLVSDDDSPAKAAVGGGPSSSSSAAAPASTSAEAAKVEALVTQVLQIVPAAPRDVILQTLKERRNRIDDVIPLLMERFCQDSGQEDDDDEASDSDSDSSDSDHFSDAEEGIADPYSAAAAAGGASPTLPSEPTAQLVEEQAMEQAVQQSKWSGHLELLPKPAEGWAQDDACPICMTNVAEDADPSDPVVCIPRANNRQPYHLACIGQHFQINGAKCPMTNKILEKLIGTQPVGSTMRSSIGGGTLAGFPQNSGIITIQYSCPGGVQDALMDRPGESFAGCSRTAYLPATEEGRQVLELLKVAHEQRLIFRVGDSVTSGARNQTTWAGIHHKTSPSGGASAYGYPDETYLARVQEELAAKGVEKEEAKSTEDLFAQFQRENGIAGAGSGAAL